MASQIDLMVDVASNSLPYLPGGKIKAYAVTANIRLASAPDIPTVDEAGLPGFHISTWYGLFDPKAMPMDVLAKLNAATVSALADSAVVRRLADLGLAIPPREQQTPERLRRFSVPRSRSGGLFQGGQHQAGVKPRIPLPLLMLWTAPPPARECH
jgi:tripartite-type tricarboxylate transporter receptor subunit TctC